jgi:hypothetical protein
MRGEKRCIDIVVGHPFANVVLPPFHFGVGERRIVLVSVVPFHDMKHAVGHFQVLFHPVKSARTLPFGGSSLKFVLVIQGLAAQLKRKAGART